MEQGQKAIFVKSQESFTAAHLLQVVLWCPMNSLPGHLNSYVFKGKASFLGCFHDREELKGKAKPQKLYILGQLGKDEQRSSAWSGEGESAAWEVSQCRASGLGEQEPQVLRLKPEFCLWQNRLERTTRTTNTERRSSVDQSWKKNSRRLIMSEDLDTDRADSHEG